MKRFGILTFLLIFAATLAAETIPCVEQIRQDGIYTSGDTVTFRITAQDEETRKLLTGVGLEYELTVDGEQPRTGKIVSSEKPFELTAARNTPGWIRIRVTLLDGKGEPVFVTKKGDKEPVAAYTGAMYDGKKIAPARPCPADFDEFWANARKELDAVPMKVSVIKSEDVENLTVKDISITCAGNAPVRGYVGMPRNAKPKSLPAMLMVQGAGVRDSNKPGVIHYASRNNCIAMDINAHGLENGQPVSFYRNLEITVLNCYHLRNKENRDTFYFRGMFLRVMRALDYLKSLPEWDEKNLLVYGASQGGAQTIVAAALDPLVTAAIAGVPAMCDHAGALAHRLPGWPQLDPKGENPEVIEASAYYDMVNFARRIHCPIMVFTGFSDTVCSPVGVMAFYNQLPADTEKLLFTVPQGRHLTSIPRQENEVLIRFLRLHK